MTKRIAHILLVAVMLLSGTTAMAQRDQGRFDKVQEYKKQFLVKELGLNNTQVRDFFPVYFAKEKAQNAIIKEVRDRERNLLRKVNPTAEECVEVARAVAELDAKTGAIEIEYFNKIKAILTPQQLLRLNAAERKFKMEMMKQNVKGNPQQQK